MASETATAPINGTYAPSQGEPGFTSTAPQAPSGGKGAVNDIPQDEVGWYFVEQYYTTLSRSPEKLFLFYNKRSQFVSGVEEEKVSVCIGQKSINERIKELDFQDCKVRITNVDSQGSDENIVIQVLGEISNKHAPHRKFAQTFVLAGQTNGYFVLNDIFRYILDEEPELEGEEAQETTGFQEPADSAVEPETTGGEAAASQEVDTEQVDEEVDEAVNEQETAEAAVLTTNGTHDEEKSEAAEEAAPIIPALPEAPASTEPVNTESKEPEKPKESETKVTLPPKETAAAPIVPAAAPKPALPKTWASLVSSANRVATPVVPSPAQTSAASQPKPAPAAQAPAPAIAAVQQANQPAREPSPANSGSEGWQTAGHEHGKRQSRVLNQGAPSEGSATRAYIKNVYENVDADALKKELSKHGEITYFDVSRAKNCAFVDFATLAAFQSAVNANPHTVGDSQIFVEERRLRPASFAFPRGSGGNAPRGRGERPAGQARGGFKQDGQARGGFNARGRGGANAPRGGRGAGQAV